MASARKLEQDINSLVETLYRLVRSFRVNEGGNEGLKQVRGLVLLKKAYRILPALSCSLVCYRQDQKALGELPEVLAERLVLTSQSLLTLIADLKRDALLSDFSSMNKLIDSRKAEHKRSRQQNEAKIHRLLSLRFEQVGSRCCMQEAISLASGLCIWCLTNHNIEISSVGL